MRQVVLLFVALAVSSLGADWTRVASGRIEVLTDAGASVAKETLGRLERIRAVFREFGPEEPRLPLRVFVFASRAEFSTYHEGALVEGFYRNRPERDFIVLQAGATGGRAVYHEYVHHVLGRAAAELPLWFQEGSAELYSNVEAGKDRLVVGRLIPEHLSTLASVTRLSAAKLAGANPRSPDYNEQKHSGIFYAQSWALVHMLNLAPGYRESLPRFVELLLESRPASEAFEAAFGRTLENALAELTGYINRMRSTTVGFARAEAPVPPVVSRVAPVTALLLRADLALHVDRAAIASGLFQKAARDFSDSPEAIAGLGTLAMSEGRWEDARRHLERAIQSLPASADLLFEYAMLERDTGATPSRVDELLRRVIVADAQHGEAQFLLGSHASDDGRWEEAVRHLEQAARVLPRRSFVWHALGLAQWKLGRAREAGVSAHRASATAATDAEEQMAATLAELVRGDAK
ncbi:MAG TPA: hypothetical protein VGP79_15860 [Bryobacteraceae bacterium]|jgi:tetratricopeptide (TPR) repeat protein|nr:hypothetical protein [Bryobacteraceae bacterium]